MKQLLCGTTALLAVSVLGGAAMAAGTPMTSANFNLKLDGQAEFKVEYQSQNPNQDVTTLDTDGTLRDQPRAYNLDFSAQLHFLGDNKLANGTHVGFKFVLEVAGEELQAAAGKQPSGIDATNDACTGTGSQCGRNRADLIDENYIYLDGRWGKLTMGGLRDERLEALDDVDIGLQRTYAAVDAVQIDTDVVTVAGANRINADTFGGGIDLDDQVNKVIWALPSMMPGLSVALNWTPDTAMENSTTNTQSDDAGQGGELWHLAAAWGGKIGGIGTRFSAAYLMQKAEDKTPSSTATGVSIASNTRWRVATDFTVGPVMFGGYYAHLVQNGPETDPEEDAVRYGLGGTYAIGVWEFGAAWEHATQDVAQRNTVGAGNAACATFGCVVGQDAATRWDIGVKYSGLGKGKVLAFGYRRDRYFAIPDGLRDSAGTTAAGTNDKRVDNESDNKTIAVKLDWTVAPGFVQTFGLENYNYTHHDGLAGAPVQKTSNAILVGTKLTF